MPELTVLFGARDRLQMKGHDAILQTLDRVANSVSVGDVYLPRQAYEQTVNDWNGKPVIFARNHPDPDAWDRDPMAELAKIEGDIIGKLEGVRIDMHGHPRLMGRLNVASPEFEALNAQGKIGLSTGLRAEIDNGLVQGVVRPHHLLVFPEDGWNQPGDKGAFILNQAADEKFEAAIKEASMEQLHETWGILEHELQELKDDKPEDPPQDPQPGLQIPDVDMTGILERKEKLVKAQLDNKRLKILNEMLEADK